MASGDGTGEFFTVFVNHVEDAALSGSSVYFWGNPMDRLNRYQQMEICMEFLRPKLEASQAPLHLDELAKKIFCAQDAKHPSKWVRVMVTGSSLDKTSDVVQVICIDSGTPQVVHINDMRAANFPGAEAQNVREDPPLAVKYMLADLVTPVGGWSDEDIQFFKEKLESHTWKAQFLGILQGVQRVRLYSEENEPFPACVEKNLGVGSSFHNVRATIQAQKSKLPAKNLISSNTWTSAQKVTMKNRSQPSTQLPARAYTAPHPPDGRHEVVVTGAPTGPLKFTVQLKERAPELSQLQKKLNALDLHPLQEQPAHGVPCIALLAKDKQRQRGLIMYTESSSSSNGLVYFVDSGKQEKLNASMLYEIPDELLRIRLYGHRVSLVGAEEVARTSGMNELFTTFVMSMNSLICEWSSEDGPQRVRLFDRDGRNILDILVALHSSIAIATKSACGRNVSPTPLFSTSTSSPFIEIPEAQVDSIERLYVVHADECGRFFGQLEKRSDVELQQLFDELQQFYEGNIEPPLLYSDVKSHIGHCGVIKWAEDERYYRIRIRKEFVNEAEILFVDYGNTTLVPRRDVLAPVGVLAQFLAQPTFGIHCVLKDSSAIRVLNKIEWENLVLDKTICIKIEERNCDGIYSVALTDDPINKAVAAVLGAKQENDTSTVKSTGTCPGLLIGDSDNLGSIQGYAEHIVKNDSKRGSNRQELPRYQHPNASTGLVKDAPLRVKGTPLQTVLREPRGPTPSSSDTKGSVGFQRKIVEDSMKKSALIEKEELRTSSPNHAEVVDKPAKKSYPRQQTLSGTMKVEVVFVTSPGSFFCQLSDPMSCDLIDGLMAKLMTSYSGHSKPILVDPKSGDACAALYREDSAWYRGQVLAVDDGKLSVVFVDYGNKQMTPADQVKAIDDEFVQLPPQAYHCRLSGLASGRTYSEKEKIRFEEATLGNTFTATFTGVDEEGKYLVTLMEGNVTLDNHFGTLADVPVPVIGFPVLPTTNQQVQVAWFYQLDKFFLTPVDISSYQIELDQLREYYGTLSASDLKEDCPRVGLPCVVRFAEDHQFYRCQILTMDDKAANVLFVDYGNEQSNTPLSELKRITSQFLQVPQLVWNCKLRGVTSAHCSAIELQHHIAASLLSGETLSVMFHSLDQDGVFSVDLRHPDPKIGDVASYLTRHKVVVRPTPEVTLAPQHLNFTPGMLISNRAFVSHLNSISEFWIQPEPNAVDLLMELIDATALRPEFISEASFSPAVGKPCLAYFAEDGRFYRAVLNTVDVESASVFYIDYGNKSTVQIADLKALPADLAQQPALAVKCALDGLDASSRDLDDVFSDLTLDATVAVKFVKIVDDVVYVRLLDKAGKDLNEQLLQHPRSPCSETLLQLDLEDAERNGEAITSKTPSAITIPTSVTTDTSSLEEPDSPFVEALEDSLSSVEELPSCTSASTECSHSLPTIREETDLEVANELPKPVCEWTPGEIMSSVAIATHISSAMEVWLQLDPATVDTLMALIDEYVSQSKFVQLPPLSEPVVGRTCLVPYTSDGRWYRGFVQSVCGDQAAVLYLDYGNTESVPISDLYCLPAEMSHLPPLAFKCALEGAKEDTKLTVEDYDSSIYDRVFHVRCSNIVGDCIYVRLLSAVEEVDINEQLGLIEVESQLALAFNEESTSIECDTIEHVATDEHDDSSPVFEEESNPEASPPNSSQEEMFKERQHPWKPSQQDKDLSPLIECESDQEGNVTQTSCFTPTTRGSCSVLEDSLAVEHDAIQWATLGIQSSLENHPLCSAVDEETTARTPTVCSEKPVQAIREELCTVSTISQLVESITSGVLHANQDRIENDDDESPIPENEIDDDDMSRAVFVKENALDWTTTASSHSFDHSCSPSIEIEVTTSTSTTQNPFQDPAKEDGHSESSISDATCATSIDASSYLDPAISRLSENETATYSVGVQEVQACFAVSGFEEPTPLVNEELAILTTANLAASIGTDSQDERPIRIFTDETFEVAESEVTISMEVDETALAASPTLVHSGPDAPVADVPAKTWSRLPASLFMKDECVNVTFPAEEEQELSLSVGNETTMSINIEDDPTMTSVLVYELELASPETFSRSATSEVVTEEAKITGLAPPQHFDSTRTVEQFEMSETPEVPSEMPFCGSALSEFRKESDGASTFAGRVTSPDHSSDAEIGSSLIDQVSTVQEVTFHYAESNEETVLEKSLMFSEMPLEATKEEMPYGSLQSDSLLSITEETPIMDTDTATTGDLMELVVSPATLDATFPLAVEIQEFDPFSPKDDDNIAQLLTPPLIAAPSVSAEFCLSDSSEIAASPETVKTFKTEVTAPVAEFDYDDSMEDSTRKATVVLSHVESPKKVWIQHAVTEQVLRDLEAVLQEIDRSQYQLERLPIPGEVYAIYHSDISKWFRGLIMESIDVEVVHVRLLDYGTTCFIHVDQVYALPGNLQLDNIPPMAMLCEIETFIDLPESWSEEEASKILRSSCFQRARAVFSPGHGNIIEGLFIEGRNIVHDLLAVAHPLLEKAEEEKVNQDQADV